MSERTARVLLAAVLACLVTAALVADLPSLSGDRFWGDGATYYAMAWSLAEDGDLRYEAEDLARVRREFASGPQGIFLKRASGGLTWGGAFPWLGRVPEGDPRTYFAKPFTYPIAAAPLVRLFGTRGLLLSNALALTLTLVFGYVELRRRTTPGRALVLVLVVVLATVAPVYLLWPAPELVNMALVAGGLVAWSRERPALSAVLLGIATYSKVSNLPLALPLGMAPLLSEGAWVKRLLESARRGLVLAATALVLFALNEVVTGEWNYQGGRERKTFYDRFPGDVEVVDGKPHPVTFGNSGISMITNQWGPRVEGPDAAAPAPRGSEPPRPAEEIRDSFVRNLGYFWVGRFGGALPYFFPAVLAVVLFLVLGPRDVSGWLALATVLASQLLYIDRIPDNWYGGSGTVGNRYFLNLLPLAFFLVPRGLERVAAAGGLLGSAVFLWPVLLSPMYHSLHHGAQATRGPFRLLPAELTMLNDLGIFSEPWRKKQPIGDTEGDPWRNWPADPKAYYLYFPDDGTYGREETVGGQGFWLRGGSAAEVVLRALEPARQMTFLVAGGPAGDEVTLRLAGRAETVAVGPGERREVSLAPGAGFMYKNTFVYVLRFASRRGGKPHGSADSRELGAFVRISLDVDKRPRSSR